MHGSQILHSTCVHNYNNNLPSPCPCPRVPLPLRLRHLDRPEIKMFAIHLRKTRSSKDEYVTIRSAAWIIEYLFHVILPLSRMLHTDDPRRLSSYPFKIFRPRPKRHICMICSIYSAR